MIGASGSYRSLRNKLQRIIVGISHEKRTICKKVPTNKRGHGPVFTPEPSHADYRPAAIREMKITST
jgi:hypothetical protein